MTTANEEPKDNSEYKEFKKYLEEEREEILKYKWIRSEEEGRDMGEEAISEWIEKFAEKYRRSHEKSTATH